MVFFARLIGAGVALCWRQNSNRGRLSDCARHLRWLPSYDHYSVRIAAAQKNPKTKTTL